MPDERPQLNEVGFYVLAGAPKTPADLLDEIPAGEALGLGSTFISERFNIKEAVTLSGAAAAASRTLGIATAATNHNTRHPAVLASYATTMHKLTGGRFTLGLGRGIDLLFNAYGIPPITTAQLEDIVAILRRLFRGEVVLGHDGPAGRYPVLHLDSSFDEDIPIGLTAFGPNSLALCGRVMDMVVLHTFFTDETVERAVRTVRTAAEEAGRDPASVRIWSCYATVHDGLPEDLRLKKTVGRLASYLQGYGDLMVRTNGWDPAVLERFRADPVVASFPGAIDDKADTDTLEHIAGLFPDEWLEPAATGSPQRCAERVLRQHDLGVDGVIMHGATPDQLAPVVDAYRSVRPAGRFDALDPNPGRTRAPDPLSNEEHPMQMDDMILVSIDDHMVEPPDMFDNHVPDKYRDLVPKVVRNDAGVDEWEFQGQKTSTPFGMAATVGWPKSEWGFNPGSYSELRPGCFDVHERVRDMDANGVLGSMNFPTMAGFNARTFTESSDKDVALVALRAYNDWAIDEWCGSYPGRFIPQGIVPMWDVDLMVEEVHRLGKKGCRSISFLETPHVQGFPSFLSGHWDPMMAALCDEGMVLSLHIGAGFEVIRRPQEAPIDHLMVLACQISAITAQDLLFGPTLRQFPDLKVALSEGGIGWIPFYFDRIDRHFQNQSWLHDGDDFGGKLPSEVFRDHILACYITDPSGLALRDRIGIDIIAWECDYPHTDTTWPESPEHAWGELQGAECSDEEIHKITWENACRFFDWDPFKHTSREDATVGALRARARAAEVDVTRMPRADWKKQNEAAGIGVR